MRGWIKYFADGAQERGLDRDVRLKKASWRNSRQTDIIKVESHHDKYMICILASGGEYWQSDNYISSLFSPDTKVTIRRIQRKTEQQENFIILQASAYILSATISINQPLVSPIPETKQQVILLTEANKGKWFTIEMDLQNGEIRSWFADGKI